MLSEILTFIDGSLTKIFTDGTWDYTNPRGEHTTGTAINTSAAVLAVGAARDTYILAQWAKGAFAGNQRFSCPL